jgi:hypothetical protein
MKIKRRTIHKIRNWSLLLILVASLGWLYKVYVEKDWFSIKEYVIIGVSEEEKKEITKRLQKASSGVSLFILPQDKILSYSHKEVVNAVSEVVPSRRDILVGPSSLQSLQVEVIDFVPVMKISENIGVTKEGIVFPTKKSLEGFPYFDSASTTQTFKEGGFTFNKLSTFDEEYIGELSSFIEKVSSILFPISKIKIDEQGDVSLFRQGEVSKVLVTTKTDLRKGWSTLVSAIDTDPLKKSLEDERDRLLYIDLRFGNKVFYKFGKDGAFSNASSTIIIDDHATSTTTTTIPQ